MMSRYTSNPNKGEFSQIADQHFLRHVYLKFHGSILEDEWHHLELEMALIRRTEYRGVLRGVVH